jgi:hypothetical protein
MKRAAINLALALANGFILVFFSERLFWSVWRTGDSVGDQLITWLAYSKPLGFEHVPISTLVFYWTTAPLGTALFVVAIVRCWAKASREPVAVAGKRRSASAR